MTESIPEPQQVAMNYEGHLDVEADAYVIDASIGEVTATITVPVEAEAVHLATLLANLPAVIDALVKNLDAEVEASAEEAEVALESVTVEGGRHALAYDEAADGEHDDEVVTTELGEGIQRG